MADQKLIDKYLNEFYQVHLLKVPIELNAYLHWMIDEALRVHDVATQNKQSPKVKDGECCLCGDIAESGWVCEDCKNRYN